MSSLSKQSFKCEPRPFKTPRTTHKSHQLSSTIHSVTSSASSSVLTSPRINMDSTQILGFCLFLSVTYAIPLNEILTKELTPEGNCNSLTQLLSCQSYDTV